jgi:hypothetical protein
MLNNGSAKRKSNISELQARKIAAEDDPSAGKPGWRWVLGQAGPMLGIRCCPDIPAAEESDAVPAY